MSKTYKAVFECKAYGERVVWYVSSHKEAQTMMRSHITSINGKKVDKRYKDAQYFLTVTEMFTSNLDTNYDLGNSWGRD